MSLYDVVLVPCKKCGHKLEFQTKYGQCLLNEFELHNAPVLLLGEIDGENMDCDKCGTNTTVHVKAIPYTL